MSDTDSFINEVTEEVRRDQLYGYLRRYGWIALVCVLLLVGGAAWNEWRKAQAAATAQARGDALLSALAEDDPFLRAAALESIPQAEHAAAVTALMTAAGQQEVGEYAAAAATLQTVVSDGELPEVYRDLAAFKAAMLPTEDMAARRQNLSALAQPGGTFSLLAQEQLAYLDLEEGDTAAAIDRLSAIIEDAGTTRGLRERAQTLMVALGADIPAIPQSN